MREPNLSDLQSWLRWVITDPRGVQDALLNPRPIREELDPLRFAPLDREGCLSRYVAPTPDCLARIESSAVFKKEDRLAVYAEAYFTRISQSLGEDFAAVRRLVGEEGFDQLVTDYLKDHPSKYPNLGEVGRFFPSFLARHEASRSLPYLSFLAELEWNVIEAYHAGALEASSLLAITETIARITPEQWPRVRFELEPSLRLLATPWSVDLFWSEEEPEIRESRRYLTIFRPSGHEGGGVTVEAIPEVSFEALEMAASGKTLGEICTKIESRDQKGASDIQVWFSEWLERGWVHSLSCQEL